MKVLKAAVIVLLCAVMSAIVISFARQQSGNTPARPQVTSHINILSVDGRVKKTVYSIDKLFEAPNWSPDGRSMILNSEGKLWRLPGTGGTPEPIPTGNVTRINNDHGISPDGRWLAISAGHIYVLPFGGGEPRQVTSETPSYYHGWSPDGRTLAYCARRGDNFDLYSIPVEGGAEKRLTTSPGYDDGPDYSPDGKWIYFNSDRSGSWDIWRIPVDGAGADDAKAERITSDDYEDWFPHPSPDGKWIIFLSFAKGTKGHPPNQDVTLRLMRAPGMKAGRPKITELTKLFGGQGTINVNSWAVDSNQFAYVSYTLRQD
ncbi:MAG TPA: transporter [Blastocatellia bacterium]|nr:transporter [Blastocatellia bacterium]